MNTAESAKERPRSGSLSVAIPQECASRLNRRST
jgi:hypothetical protein